MQTPSQHLSEVSPNLGINPMNGATGVHLAPLFAGINQAVAHGVKQAVIQALNECAASLQQSLTTGVTATTGDDWKAAIRQLFADGATHTTTEIKTLMQRFPNVGYQAWVNWIGRSFEAVSGQRGTYKLGSAKH